MKLGPEAEKQTSIGNRTKLAPSSSSHYTRFVGRLKVVLPLVAGVLALAVLVWPQITQGWRNAASANSLIAGIGRLTMANPRYYGVDEKNQVYSITADQAIQTDPEHNALELKKPKGEMALEDGSSLEIDAQTGYYLREGKSLNLSGGVNLYHDGGYEVHTQSADIDLEAGAAQGSEPVQGSGKFGEIESEGFHLTDRGKNIVFTGKSKLTLRNTDALDKEQKPVVDKE